MKAYKIDRFISQSEDKHFITKFGGQPDWIEQPQWPVSLAWDNRPLKFISLFGIAYSLRINYNYTNKSEFTHPDKGE